MSQQTKSRKAKKQSKKNNKKITWKKVLLALLILAFLAFIIVVGVVFSYIKDAPPLNADELKVPLSTTILDRNGEMIADLGVEKRKEIEYDDIPQVLEDAVLATEDNRFFEHSGIDIFRMGAAVIANLTDGFGAQGASTITQQVVKNAFLSHDKKLKRKIQEQYLAIQLEQEYSKEQIFTMYLNQIYYGKSIYGVQKASEAFFGKSDLHDLTLAEAALLAGIPQRPNAHNPFNNPELAEKRRNTVLDLMVHHGKITEAEANEVKQIKVVDMIRDDYVTETPYEAFIERVLEEAEEILGEDVDIYSAGLTIHTTLDPKAQDHIEYLLSEESPIAYPEGIEAGIAALNTKTGEILAIGGGRNKAEGIGASFNYALNPNGRQPGSAIKPIVDYGPAIEHLKWSTYHQILDEPYSYRNDKDKIISNAGRGYFGHVSLREAFYRSLNVPAVKTFHELGEEIPSQFARGLGLEFEGNLYESDAIGGGKIQVNPLQMAGAYAAFGNGGIYNEPYAITKIVFPDQQTIDLKHEAKIAMSDYTAYMVTDVLKDVIKNPAGTAYRNTDLGNLPVAGKTGTTNRGDNVTPDSWMAGYTTNFTVAVWSGYPEEQHIEGTYQSIPQQLFSNIMNFMSNGIETADFVRPDSVLEIKVEKGSNPAQLPSEFTPDDQIVTELFVKGTEPTETSDEYDQLDPVENFNVEYIEEDGLLNLYWEHPSLFDEDNDKNITFELSVAVDDGDFQVISTSSDTEYTFTDIQKGATYSFKVVAVNNENEEQRSEPVQKSIDIPEDESDIIDDLIDDEDDDENGDDGDGNEGNGNNGNQGGNDNQGNNGNQGNGEGNENNDGQNGEHDSNESDQPTDAQENSNG
ncbi:PBP1A family penicillin-binding protein [Bacillaceae bacterium W0354]